MRYVIASTKCAAISILLSAVLFIACGDESSSSAPTADPSEESSSSVEMTNESSSSDAEKNSSSSVSGENSSSSAVESSSSEFVFHRCDDGDTSSSEGGGFMYYFICKDNEWEEYKRVNLDSLDSLAAIEKNKEHPNMDSLFAGYSGEYLEFEDPRDGHKYKYVEFKWIPWDGKGKETFYVMSENLNYGKMVLGGTKEFDDDVTEKLCYVDDEWFCDNHFGGLYTWAEAMNLPKVCDSVAVDSNDACKSFADAVKSVSDPRVVRWQGICPDGWHIMNQYEWAHTTENSAGLKSKAVWEENAGLNGYGMAIIPTERLPAGDLYTVFWMPSASKSNAAKAVYFFSNSNNVDSSGGDINRKAFRSVRCVMDANNTLTH